MLKYLIMDRYLSYLYFGMRYDALISLLIGLLKFS